MSNISIISASAGSGKTYSLKEELKRYLSGEGDVLVRPNAVIATTFTKKAAVELKERARMGLYEKNLFDEANLFSDSLVGTVHSVCGNILKKYCYEAGLSPELEIITEEDEKVFFEIAMSQVISPDVNKRMYEFTQLFSFISKGFGESHDFRSDLKKIINLIRINNIGQEKIEESKTNNTNILKGLINPLESDLHTFCQLAASLDVAISTMESAAKMDKKSIAILPIIKRLKGVLDNGIQISWEDLAKISVPGVGKVGIEALADSSSIATSLLSSNLLLQNIEEYQNTIFDLSELAISNYQKYKEERGVIDYTDMEVLVSNLLDDDLIKDRIKEDFDLLMVDEFQDTNPIQLNIFLKLSNLVKKTIWVGDPKQSIYGFRGADPILMNQLIAELDNGENISILENSYRSRSCLVNTSNTISKVLFKDVLADERIILNSTREEKPEFSTGFNILRFNPERRGSKERMNRSLAHAVKNITDSNISIQDRDTGEIRPLVAGDIAILCRFNSTCSSIAEYLKEEGVESAVERTGLLETPEGALLSACLRFFNSKYDDLSKFELILLADPEGNVENFLNDRLQFINEGSQSRSNWKNDHPWIVKINSLREELVDASISEILDRIIIDLGIKPHVTLWGRSSLRKANIEKYRELSEDFEERANRLNLPCTLTGYLLWLSSEDVSQGAGVGNSAVNIITYHRSKGLEWPVVIMAEMDAGAKARGFGIEIQSSGCDFDINNPLAGRWIRFLTNPFGSKKNVPMITNLEGSEIYSSELEKGIEENARVMYVGITRARDYLYFVDRGDTGLTWLNEIYTKKDETFDYEREDGEHTFDEQIPYTVKNYPMLDHFETNVTLPNQFDILKTPIGRQEFDSYRVIASSIDSDSRVQDIKEYDYGTRLAINGEVEDNVLGDCLHNILANQSFKIDDVKRILENYGLSENLDSQEVLTQVGKFYNFLESEFKVEELNNEWPIQRIENGQSFTGVIDLWGKSKGSVLVIDHKSFRGTDFKKKSAEFIPQLLMYKNLLKDLKGAKRIFINFVSQGKLVEIFEED